MTDDKKIVPENSSSSTRSWFKLLNHNQQNYTLTKLKPATSHVDLNRGNWAPLSSDATSTSSNVDCAPAIGNNFEMSLKYDTNSSTNTPCRLVRIFCEAIRKGSYFVTIDVPDSMTVGDCIQEVVNSNLKRGQTFDRQRYHLVEVIGRSLALKPACESRHKADTISAKNNAVLLDDSQIDRTFSPIHGRILREFERIMDIFSMLQPSPGHIRRLEIHNRSSLLECHPEIPCPPLSMGTSTSTTEDGVITDSELNPLTVPKSPFLLLLRGSTLPNKDLLVHDLGRLVDVNPREIKYMLSVGLNDAQLFDICLYDSVPSRKQKLAEFMGKTYKEKYTNGMCLSSTRICLEVPEVHAAPLSVLVNDCQLTAKSVELKPGDLLQFGQATSDFFYLFLFKDPRHQEPANAIFSPTISTQPCNSQPVRIDCLPTISEVDHLMDQLMDQSKSASLASALEAHLVRVMAFRQLVAEYDFSRLENMKQPRINSCSSEEQATISTNAGFSSSSTSSNSTDELLLTRLLTLIKRETIRRTLAVLENPKSSIRSLIWLAIFTSDLYIYLNENWLGQTWACKSNIVGKFKLENCVQVIQLREQLAVLTEQAIAKAVDLSCTRTSSNIHFLINGSMRKSINSLETELNNIQSEFIEGASSISSSSFASASYARSDAYSDDDDGLPLNTINGTVKKNGFSDSLNGSGLHSPSADRSCSFSRIEVCFWQSFLAFFTRNVLEWILCPEKRAQLGLEIEQQTGKNLISGIQWLQTWLSERNLEQYQTSVRLAYTIGRVMALDSELLYKKTWQQLRMDYTELPGSFLRYLLEEYKGGQAAPGQAEDWSIPLCDCEAAQIDPLTLNESICKTSLRQARENFKRRAIDCTYFTCPEVILKRTTNKEHCKQLDLGYKSSGIGFSWESLMAKYPPSLKVLTTSSPSVVVEFQSRRASKCSVNNVDRAQSVSSITRYRMSTTTNLPLHHNNSFSSSSESAPNTDRSGSSTLPQAQLRHRMNCGNNNNVPILANSSAEREKSSSPFEAALFDSSTSSLSVGKTIGIQRKHPSISCVPFELVEDRIEAMSNDLDDKTPTLISTFSRQKRISEDRVLLYNRQVKPPIKTNNSPVLSHRRLQQTPQTKRLARSTIGLNLKAQHQQHDLNRNLLLRSSVEHYLNCADSASVNSEAEDYDDFYATSDSRSNIGSLSASPSLYSLHQLRSEEILMRFQQEDELVGKSIDNVVLLRPRGRGFGLKLVDGEATEFDQPGVYVKSIATGSPADLSGQIKPGFRILSINGKDLMNYTYSEALNLLKLCPTRTVFTVMMDCVPDPKVMLQSKSNTH